MLKCIWRSVDYSYLVEGPTTTKRLLPISLNVINRSLGSKKKSFLTHLSQSWSSEWGFPSSYLLVPPFLPSRLPHVRLPRLCNGHCNLLTNNKDAPCLAVNFTSSGVAKWAWHARKGFVVVCDSLCSLLCRSLGAGDYNLPVAQHQNIPEWIVRGWKKKKSSRPRVQPLLHESGGILP